MAKTAQELFDTQVPDSLAKSSAKAREIGAIFLFQISGDGGGEWTVDLASAEPSCQRGNPEQRTAHCTIEIAHEDFKDMLRAPPLPMQLYFQGKLKVTGDAGDEAAQAVCHGRLSSAAGTAGPLGPAPFSAPRSSSLRELGRPKPAQGKPSRTRDGGVAAVTGCAMRTSADGWKGPSRRTSKPGRQGGPGVARERGMRLSVFPMALVLCAFSLVIGCGGGAGGTGAACGEAHDGDPCSNVGETCSIGDDCGGQEWRCESDHQWSVVDYDSVCCGQTPCPDVPPNEGEGCTPCYPACQWESLEMCGNLVVEATCGEDWAWHVTASSSCDCSAYGTEAACNADPKCRYLTPDECNDPTFTESACHPKESCSADNPCAAGKTCTPVTANDTDCELPCQLCMEVSICL